MMDHPTLPKWVFDDSDIDDPLGKGQHAVDFFNSLQHPNSEFQNQRFILPHFWERIVRRIYGPRDEDGERVVRQVFIMIPRGARKTSIAGGIGLYHTIAKDVLRPEGQVLLAAGSKEQAGQAFGEARKLLETTNGGVLVQTKDNKKGLTKILGGGSIKGANKAIRNLKYGTTLTVQSADGDLSHGTTPSVVIYDELHIFKSRTLWAALQTGLSKVKEPLQIVITTAGRGQSGLAWEEYQYAKKVAIGEIVNPHYLPILFEPPSSESAWDDQHLWGLVNPGLAEGFPDAKGLAILAESAKEKPADLDDFKQYHLNFWLSQSLSPFVSMPIYDEGASAVDIESHQNAQDPCWIAVDLGFNSDLSAVVVAWPHREGMELEYDVQPYFFCPQAMVDKRGNDDAAKYKDWADKGFLTPTPGNATDYTKIKELIIELCGKFNVKEIAFDPKFASEMINSLLEQGLPAVTMQQGWVTMAPAIKELDRAIISRRFSHGGHPVLRWNFENIAVHTDSAGNKTFHKGKSKDKIDGAQATAMAVGRAFAGMSPEVEPTPFWAEDSFDPERALGIGDKDTEVIDAEAEAKMDAELREMLGLN
jgi:phage terminase large subunit-like protein